MRYELSEEKIEDAKKILRALKKKEKLWTNQWMMAQEELKTCANKHYYAIKQKIRFFQKQIDTIQKQIEDLKEVIKKGYIDV